MVDQAELQARLQEVRSEFEQQLPQRGEQIAACCERLKREQHGRDALQELYRMVHNLAGAGGTFGHAAISTVARQVADPLRSLLAGSEPQPAEAELQLLEAACMQLVGLCRAPSHSSSLPLTGALGQAGWLGMISERDPLYLLGESKALQTLAAELRAGGREVHSVIADRDTLSRIRSGPLVVDIACLQSSQLSRLLPHLPRRPPLVVVSERDDYEARLAATRAGADAFLAVPVDTATLSRRIRTLGRPADDPFRVLIVDDDREQARYTALLLERHDIRPRLLNEPQQLIRQLREFSPHLILLDLYLPECSGTELARMVRQYDPGSPVSILFLSVERDRSAQLAALQWGADDFLTKPISPDELVAAVRYRLARGRALCAATDR